MGKQKLTSKTYVHLPDGRVLPVSTVHDAGGAEMQIKRHLPCEQWEQMVQKMMERAGGDVGLLQRADGQAIT